LIGYHNEHIGLEKIELKQEFWKNQVVKRLISWVNSFFQLKQSSFVS
jgi:hypothetical protein